MHTQKNAQSNNTNFVIISFYNGQSVYLEVEGYKLGSSGNKTWFTDKITKDSFVPHSQNYFKDVAKAICSKRQALKRGKV